MLIGSERFHQTKLKASDSAALGGVSVCPNALLGQIGGVYYYSGFALGADCMLLQMYGVTATRLHDVGNCPDCPDPIFVPAGHPVPLELPETSAVPQPDPRFSGVLR